MALVLYTYSEMDVVDLFALEREIRDSSIQIALDHVDHNEQTGLVSIYFKSALATEDVAWLDQVTGDHTGDPVFLPPPLQEVKFQHSTTEDNIPYVYSTSKPLNHIVYFCGSGDDMTNPDIKEGRGDGSSMLFNMKQGEATKTVDIQFNTDVYLKDGMIHSEDAPFGATIDIEAWHPYYGFIDFFGKNVPILGSGWFPLNTEDKASVPAGLIIRVRVNNATGLDGSDPAADFKVAGRLELFRPKLTQL